MLALRHEVIVLFRVIFTINYAYPSVLLIDTREVIHWLDNLQRYQNRLNKS